MWDSVSDSFFIIWAFWLIRQILNMTTWSSLFVPETSVTLWVSCWSVSCLSVVWECEGDTWRRRRHVRSVLYEAGRSSTSPPPCYTYITQQLMSDWEQLSANWPSSPPGRFLVRISSCKVTRPPSPPPPPPPALHVLSEHMQPVWVEVNRFPLGWHCCCWRGRVTLWQLLLASLSPLRESVPKLQVACSELHHRLHQHQHPPSLHPTHSVFHFMRDKQAQTTWRGEGGGEHAAHNHVWFVFKRWWWCSDSCIITWN